MPGKEIEPMKNYIVIAQFNNEGTISAKFYDVEHMDLLDKSQLEASLTLCTELPLVTGTQQSALSDTTLERNKLYKFEFDAYTTDIDYSYATSARSYEEHVMRWLGYRKCDVCGAWVSPQDIHNRLSTYENGQRRCATCIANEAAQEANSKRIRLGAYHSTRNFKVWTPDGNTDILPEGKYVGIEMEMNGAYHKVRSGVFKATDEFYAIANSRSRKQVFHCESDCTVAAEFISNCFTKESFKLFDWSILTDQLKRLGNDEHYAQVGFHIHLSKTLLGDTESQQIDNFLKLQYILNKYENDFYKVSGRNSRSEMGYCRFWSIDQIERLRANTHWYEMPCGHDSALISSGHTIELRICHSTNDSDRIIHTLELVWNLVENIKNVRWEKLWCLGKLFKSVPTETMNYWRQKGCFLHTYAVSERGMSATASC